MNHKPILALITAACASWPLWAAASENSTSTITATISAGTTTRTGVDSQLRDDQSYLREIGPRYLSFVGSRDNLSSLANGLRTGSPITLLGNTGTAITFTAPTKPMGYGNITHTFDLAMRELAAAGITSPTPQQLQAALTGGSVTDATGIASSLPGVLQLRSQGMGWGKIAQTIEVSPSSYSKAAANSHVAITDDANMRSGTGKTSGITTAGNSVRADEASETSGKSGIVTASGNHGTSARSDFESSDFKSRVQPHSGIVSAAGGGMGFASAITSAQGGGAISAAGGLANGHGGTAGSGHGNAFGKFK